MRLKMQLLLIILLYLKLNNLQAQINFDYTDSLVNAQKTFVIRYDVKNGNIYIPIKKKLKDSPAKLRPFNAHLYKPNSKKIILFKQELIDGKIKDIAYDTVINKDPANAVNDILKYLVAGRYLKPKVGGFIKLVFENVPKDEDVKVSVDFIDKNLENANSFSNYLNASAKILDSAYEKNNKIILEKINEKEKEIDETQKQDSIVAAQNANTLINTTFNTQKISAALTNITNGKSNKPINFSKIIKPIDSVIDSLEAKVNSQKNKLDEIKEDTSEGAKNLKLQYYIDSTLKSNLDSFKAMINNKINNANKQSSDKQKVLQTLVDKIKDIVKTEQDKNTKNQDNNRKKLTTQFKKIAADTIKIRNVIDSLKDLIYHPKQINIIPFQVENSDLTSIKIDFLKADNKGSYQPYAARELLLKNKQGFKLDFSTGFLGMGLKDESYRLYTKNNDSSVIIQNDKGKFNIGFGLLAHAYFRTGERVNVALTTGFAINGSSQTINYVAGISMPWGLENRIVLSAGMVFGKVKKLTTGFKATTNTDSIYAINTNQASVYWYKGIQTSGVPMEEKWASSFFIGISYNLGTLSGGNKKSFKLR